MTNTESNMATPVKYHLGKFPPTNIDWKQLVPLLGQANISLGRYDELLKGIPDADVLLSPLMLQEAVLSSKIEGIYISLSEVLEIEAGGDGVTQSKRDDAEEVLNYREALNFASHALDERSFSLHLLREAHELLMRGVRGHDKKPGAFRDVQNWIGYQGGANEEASFIPIPPEQLSGGMERWLEYFLSTDGPDLLVQLAVIHLEFEALHPFMDGNGRLGRMVIPLFLYHRKILRSPDFYMSGYLEARRDQYIEAMRAVSRDGAWTQWCAFFLQGIIEQASQNQRKAEAILELHRRMRRAVAEATRSQYADLAVDFIFARPVFSSPDFAKKSGIPELTASRILRVLKSGKVNILDTIRPSSGSRPSILAFPELLYIAEGTGGLTI